VTKKTTALFLLLSGLLLIGSALWYGCSPQATSEPVSTSTVLPPTLANTPIPTLPVPTETPPVTPAPEADSFDGQRAYEDVKTQVAMGPRVPRLEGHAQIQAWIEEELVQAGWQVEIQESEALGHPIENIVARRVDEPPQIILGAHYDTRMHADKDPDPSQRTNPVPGANDGASGVSVLLELARSLPEGTVPVWLVFFDAEDNGNIEGWDWILGSREFVANNPVQPRAAVIVDMIGEVDLNIYKELNSNPELTDEIWAVARELGYETKFIPEYKHSMLDDHTPFVQAGIPAVDIIDFDYPYWHTVQDTPDKVSAESLDTVGETLFIWVVQQSQQP
jgi:hypothetical protein